MIGRVRRDGLLAIVLGNRDDDYSCGRCGWTIESQPRDDVVFCGSYTDITGFAANDVRLRGGKCPHCGRTD